VDNEPLITLIETEFLFNISQTNYHRMQALACPKCWGRSEALGYETKSVRKLTDNLNLLSLLMLKGPKSTIWSSKLSKVDLIKSTDLNLFDFQTFSGVRWLFFC
jgi:hypothetical protein